MIRIGYTDKDKTDFLELYLKNHSEIDKVYCFYSKSFPIVFNIQLDIEYIEFEDTIMYVTFYRLLEIINDKSLLIFSECMRTGNRADLHYNCMHHYINSTPHKIVFEYFPIISSKEDFMILLNYENKGKYHGKGFDFSYLQEEDIIMKPKKFSLQVQEIKTSALEKACYEEKKEDLFDNLGLKDPDTIPRGLQLTAGNYKKKAILDECIYVARNKRFNRKNVLTYKEIKPRKDYIVLDFHYRRLNFNDFLKFTGIESVSYIATDLSIDKILIQEFEEWIARLEDIYAQASLLSSECF